ncbi:MAG: hypothetical protein AAGC55_31055, partial [Myxococcota bacterium]
PPSTTAPLSPAAASRLLAHGLPSYSLRLLVRKYGPGEGSIRMLFNASDSDSDPTDRDSFRPVVARFDGDELDSDDDVPDDGRWHRVDLPIPGDFLTDSSGNRAAEVRLFLRLLPPNEDTVYLDIDDIQLVEWRRSTAIPERFADYHFLRNDSAGEVTVTIPAKPLLEIDVNGAAVMQAGQ